MEQNGLHHPALSMVEFPKEGRAGVAAEVEIRVTHVLSLGPSHLNEGKARVILHPVIQSLAVLQEAEVTLRLINQTMALTKAQKAMCMGITVIINTRGTREGPVAGVPHPLTVVPAKVQILGNTRKRTTTTDESAQGLMTELATEAMTGNIMATVITEDKTLTGHSFCFAVAFLTSE